jgi:acyl carrier protein
MKIKKVQKDLEKEVGKKINLEKSFIENNFDSLDIITSISFVEDFFKIKLSDAQLKKIKNFKDLEKKIKN